MRSIMPSASVEREHLTLVSSLRAQGFAIQPAAARPQAGVSYLVAAGEPIPAPARTLIVGSGQREVLPFRDGQPARIAYGHEDATVGNAFARALIGGPELPTAADPESLALLALAERVAQADITVLINGPTGTGKEVLARTIHLQSERRDGPFIAINCAALPETMLEAMLFGHQKGSFTGASSGGDGFFRAANGGTLLLDEVAEMPLNLQAKLLRVLQEREVVPIGATMPQPVDVRVIACANRDLQEEVAAGRFRADLYYRLSVFPLTTKALAERAQDIPALAATMILRHAGNRPVVPWPSDEAIATLVAHDWPGNVRELENVIQRALLFCGGDTIEAAHIVFDRPSAPRLAPVAQPVDDATLGQVVQLSEFAAIRETLAACGGSRIETAKRLGISERTLRYRLAKAREQGDDLASGTQRAISA
ncbi:MULTISPECIES: sigma-54-dependent Fis family transcriptional regulator [unclassified Sphingomonas]|uniref:sigma-54 interaction domain-containing protein n=1 Tax=unclassified Sphingomonas TaxID=196159 RepID=UPI0016204041|nr:MULTISPECIES: sigma 54-interacting transcriptional regulator [unclassified Sphingomonas]MBB3347622.1 two-component system response regulator FlrC [Sphingomonas sp. BK069]MBB3472420.1 two-component system response regulator FlrC [Sphingomonas sp. BK345]